MFLVALGAWITPRFANPTGVGLRSNTAREDDCCATSVQIERLAVAYACNPPVLPSPRSRSPSREVKHDRRSGQRARECASRSRPGAVSGSGQLGAPLP